VEGKARWRLVAAAIAGSIVGLFPSAASAHHIPGATYSGYVTGGGTISFSVSADGSSVTNLALAGPIVTLSCTLDSASYPGPTPINNHAFDNGDVSGSFPNVQGARGGYDIFVPTALPPCRAVGTWTATTRADPSGSQECQAALAEVRRTKRALAKARKGGSKKKISRARKRWLQARATRDRECG
jgi:hypothetical protein